MLFIGRIDLSIVSGKFRNLRESLVPVLPHKEVSVIREWGEERRILRVDLVPVLFQLQVSRNFWREQAAQVRRNRDAVSGPDLFGDARATRLIAPLQYQHTLSGLRQVSCRDQPIVPAAYYNCIVSRYFARNRRRAAHLLCRAHLVLPPFAANDSRPDFKIFRQQSMKKMFARLSANRKPSGLVRARTQSSLYRLADIEIFHLDPIADGDTLRVLFLLPRRNIREVKIKDDFGLIDRPSGSPDSYPLRPGKD